MTTTLFLGSILIFAAVIVAALMTYVRWRRPALATFVVLSVLLSMLRVGAFWFLTYLEWTHQQTLSALPLTFLLLPEGIVLAQGFPLSWTTVTWFTLLLIAGSTAIGGIAGAFVALTRRGLGS